jgi:hypothetical protein
MSCGLTMRRNHRDVHWAGRMRESFRLPGSRRSQQGSRIILFAAPTMRSFNMQKVGFT